MTLACRVKSRPCNSGGDSTPPVPPSGHGSSSDPGGPEQDCLDCTTEAKLNSSLCLPSLQRAVAPPADPKQSHLKATAGFLIPTVGNLLEAVPPSAQQDAGLQGAAAARPPPPRSGPCRVLSGVRCCGAVGICSSILRQQQEQGSVTDGLVYVCPLREEGPFQASLLRGGERRVPAARPSTLFPTTASASSPIQKSTLPV